MAVSKQRYKSLNHTLKMLRVQVMDGIPYALNECPRMDSPQEIFEWLKMRTKFEKDPKNTELLQTLPTLLDYNRHGVTGYGDCDCFTIAYLTLLIANGFGDCCGICLVGRNRAVPVHIYAYCDANGKREYLDRTNNKYDKERSYAYKQEIPFKLNPLEKKQMILELADGNELSSKKGKARRHAKRELKHDLKFKQSVENLKTAYDTSTPEISPEVDQNYTYLPESDMHVRNDVYDDMSAGEFQNTMLSEGVSPAKILELSAGRAARKMIKAKGKVSNKGLRISKKQKVSGADKAATRMKLFDKAGNLLNTYIGGKKVSNDDGGGNTPAPANNTPAPSGGGFSFSDIPMPVKILGGLAIGFGIFMAVKPKHARA